MSTVDPSAKEMARRKRGFGNEGRLLLVAFSVVWIVVGISGGMAADLFRTMTLNTAAQAVEPEFGWERRGTIAFVVLFLAVFGGCVLGALLHKPLSYSRALSPVWRAVLRAVVALAAIAAGLCVFLPWWTMPFRIGTNPGDPTAPRGPLEGISYTAPVWLPASFLLLAAILLAVVLLRAARGSWIAQNRTRVLGTVTRVEFTRVAIGGGEGIPGDPVVKVAVRFTDVAGTRRWVTRRIPHGRSGHPREGTTVPLYYDPRRPSSTRRIRVDFPRAW